MDPQERILTTEAGGSVYLKPRWSVEPVLWEELRDELPSAGPDTPLDAAEFVGPWTDIWLGLHNAAGYYYYPGFHEPGMNQTLGINRTVWEGLAPSDQALIKAAAQAGWMDERQAALESLVAIKRAGADLIVSYWTRDLPQWL